MQFSFGRNQQTKRPVVGAIDSSVCDQDWPHASAGEVADDNRECFSLAIVRGCKDDFLQLQINVRDGI
jgi:hypothetical protein